MVLHCSLIFVFSVFRWSTQFVSKIQNSSPIHFSYHFHVQFFHSFWMCFFFFLILSHGLFFTIFSYVRLFWTRLHTHRMNIPLFVCVFFYPKWSGCGFSFPIQICCTSYTSCNSNNIWMYVERKKNEGKKKSQRKQQIITQFCII